MLEELLEGNQGYVHAIPDNFPRGGGGGNFLKEANGDALLDELTFSRPDWLQFFIITVSKRTMFVLYIKSKVRFIKSQKLVNS